MKHTCHWPGCQVEVPPKLWGCKKHWFMVPKEMKEELLKHYRPGQEIDKDPSEEYIDAAMDIYYWAQEKNKEAGGLA